jgi:hypothetical protein
MVEENATLKACFAQLDAEDDKKDSERRKKQQDAKEARDAEKSEEVQLRRPIVEAIVIGYHKWRGGPLGQEQLRYLLKQRFQDLDPRKYIERNVASNANPELQTLNLKGDVAKFLNSLATKIPAIFKEAKALRADLKGRACAIIIQYHMFGEMSFPPPADLIVADYLTHVINIAGFEADATGAVTEESAQALMRSRFAKSCLSVWQEEQQRAELAIVNEDDEDDEDNPFKELGPLRAQPPIFPDPMRPPDWPPLPPPIAPFDDTLSDEGDSSSDGFVDEPWGFDVPGL